MSVFFNGRLLITPTSASVVDDSALANRNLTVGNVLAILGSSEGGAPNTPLRFGSPSEAAAVLKSGTLLEAVKRAFDPSAQTGGPSTIVAVRVNPALQSTLALERLSNSQTALTLVSTDYGLYANRIRVKVENGTTVGKKLTTQLDQAYYSADNIERPVISLRYTGGQSTAVLSCNNAGLTVVLGGVITVTVDFLVYDTVSKVVDYLSGFAGVVCSIVGGQGAHPTLNALDTVSGQDVKTATYTMKADLQACVDWFNSVGEGFVTATRAAGAGEVPKNIAFTYLAGGSDGTITNTEWSNAFVALQSEDVQWVVPMTGDASIHAMADAHCAYMSTVGKMERRAFCGMNSGSSDAAAITAAFNLNSDRTALMHIGMYDYNAAGVLTLYPPYMTAALVAGAFAGSNPGTAMTNKTLKVRGLERYLRNPTDTDILIDAGLLCVEKTNSGFKVVKSISTWLVNDNYNRVEVSTGCAIDFVVRNVRDALDVLRGEKGSPLLLSRAVSIAESRLKELARPEPSGPGVIVGDAASPPYRSIRATLEGDVLRVEFQCSPAIPANYVLTTVYAVPYSGSASAA